MCGENTVTSGENIHKRKGNSCGKKDKYWNGWGYRLKCFRNTVKETEVLWIETEIWCIEDELLGAKGKYRWAEVPIVWLKEVNTVIRVGNIIDGRSKILWTKEEILEQRWKYCERKRGVTVNGGGKLLMGKTCWIEGWAEEKVPWTEEEGSIHERKETLWTKEKNWKQEKKYYERRWNIYERR